jgi:hypothetical protein
MRRRIQWLVLLRNTAVAHLINAGVRSAPSLEQASRRG